MTFFSISSSLGASASDFVPYKPFFASNQHQHQHQQQSSNVWQPYSKTDDRWLQKSKNQRRKANKKNPPPQSPFLPPTVNNLAVPAPPQPANFTFAAENNEYLTQWMNTYNPYISFNNSRINNRINNFNFNGNFYNWCMERGLGASAPCA